MNEWISVKDRLPDVKGDYVCFVKGTGIRIRLFTECITGYPMRWFSNGSETKKVTHWLPLIDPPNIEQHEHKHKYGAIAIETNNKLLFFEADDETKAWAEYEFNFCPDCGEKLK